MIIEAIITKIFSNLFCKYRVSKNNQNIKLPAVNGLKPIVRRKKENKRI